LGTSNALPQPVIELDRLWATAFNTAKLVVLRVDQDVPLERPPLRRHGEDTGAPLVLPAISHRGAMDFYCSKKFAVPLVTPVSRA
jgi:hypothetical protein